MRSLLVLAIASLSLSTIACGDMSKGASSTSRASSISTTSDTTSSATTSTATSTKPTVKVDRDGDTDNNEDDYGYGQAASTADRQAIAVLLRHYYTAAAADDGAAGCALIYSLIAEEIPELYGEQAGSPELQGTTCAQVITKLFKLHHRQLVIDAATLKVNDVRVKHLRALAILSFQKMPQRDILVHREHSVWKVDELLDSDLG